LYKWHLLPEIIPGQPVSLTRLQRTFVIAGARVITDQRPQLLHNERKKKQLTSFLVQHFSDPFSWLHFFDEILIVQEFQLFLHRVLISIQQSVQVNNIKICDEHVSRTGNGIYFNNK